MRTVAPATAGPGEGSEARDDGSGAANTRFGISLASLFVVFAATLLYLPWACRACVVTTDRDVLSMLGWLRATGDGIGWPVGYYVNSLLSTTAARLLDVAGLARNDYVLGYQMVALAALTLLSVGAYALVQRATASMRAAMTAAAMVALTPGMVRLLYLLEDNLINQAFQMQHLLVYVWYVGQWRRRQRGSVFGAAELAFCTSLWLAVNSHHQMNVLWATPAALLLFLRRGLPIGRQLQVIGSLYAVTVGMFLALYVFLTIQWTGGFSLDAYAESVTRWFVPSRYYQGFYFFNRIGWDLAALAREIAVGLSLLVRIDNPVDPFLYAAYVILGMVLAPHFLRHVRASVPLGAAALFVVLNVPHSLTFEPSNLERWDAPVVPGIVALMITLALAWKNVETRRPVSLIVATAAVGAILGANTFFYGQTMAQQRDAIDEAGWQSLQPLLLAQVDPQNADVRRVLVLSDQEFDKYFMVAEAFFDHRQDIYAVSPDGSFYRSPTLFPTKEAVENFDRETSGAEIVLSAGAAAVLTHATRSRASVR